MVLVLEDLHWSGFLEAGLGFLQEVEDSIDDTKERLAESPLYLYRGKLLQRQGHAAPAEACFVHALTLARQRGAKGTELRVATLLSRLWQKQGEREKARAFSSPSPLATPKSPLLRRLDGGLHVLRANAY